MSAHDQVRAMLDELMGTARDGDASRCRMKFDDPRRMDLGECPKFHDLALRADFETASKKKDYFYDIDALEHLQNFIGECDRKTEMYKRRLKETQEELSEEANSKAESIHSLGEEIGTKLAKAETLGAEGKVDESMTLMNNVEELKKQKTLAETDYKNSMPASSYQQQKLRVCEICSAYLGIHDNDRRLADHFGGKLHIGFITIRDKLAELKVTHADRIRQRGEEREIQRQLREEERKQETDSKSRRSRSRSRGKRSRSRSGSRKRRTRSRSRSRRSRSHSRSRHSKKSSRRRSRSRSRRSRSRSKKRTSAVVSRRHTSVKDGKDNPDQLRRSRSRSRSRSRRRRSRSRSRNRRHRSSHKRSKSRSRSKSKENKKKSVENGSKATSPEQESKSSAEIPAVDAK